jgi:hypothetical protein
MQGEHTPQLSDTEQPMQTPHFLNLVRLLLLTAPGAVSPSGRATTWILKMI